jgi:heptosyltransferase-1
VLASPFAGWKGKQWPLEFYADLGSRLSAEGLPLVLNVSPKQAPMLLGLPNLRAHVSSLSGLIHATRRAAAVVGVDSGPLHLAAALRKPGVAVFGPTDPAATGPYGGTMTVLRTEGVATTYRRDTAIHPSMKAIRPEALAAALLACLTVRA